MARAAAATSRTVVENNNDNDTTSDLDLQIRICQTQGVTESPSEPLRFQAYVDKTSQQVSNENSKSPILKWKLSRAQWSSVKSYSPRIKLLIQNTTESHNPESSSSSTCYCMLDLRSVPKDRPSGPKWIPIVKNSKSSRFPYSNDAKVQVEISISKHHHHERALQNEEPVLEQEYLPLGKRNGSTIFILSVSLGTAAHLDQYISSLSSSAVPPPHTGMWFSYTLLDVVVQTDIFYNTRDVEYAPVRDSFRLKSCIEDILEFITTEQILTVYLCTSHCILGAVDVALMSLFDNNTSFDNNFTQAQLNGNFKFSSTNNLLSNLPVSIRLEKESIASENYDSASNNQDTVESVFGIQQAVILLLSPSLSEDVSGNNDQVIVTISHQSLSSDNRTISVPMIKSSNKFIPESPKNFLEWSQGDSRANGGIIDLSVSLSYGHDFRASGSISVLDSQVIGKTDSQIIEVQLLRENEEVATVVLDWASNPDLLMKASEHSHPEVLPLLPSPPSTNNSDRRRYRFSIDTKSINGVTTKGNLILTYPYPQVGKAGFVRSEKFKKGNPSAEIPSGYSCFEFTMERDELLKVVLETPLLYSLYKTSSSSSSSEKLLGTSKLSLESLKSALVNNTSEFTTTTLSTPVIADNNTVIGTINTVVTIQDLGSSTNNDDEDIIISTMRDAADVKSDTTTTLKDDDDHFNTIASNKTSSTTELELLRENTKLAARAEIEQEFRQKLESARQAQEAERLEWETKFRAEQEVWRKQMMEGESERMADLEREWASRETERQASVRASQVEYSKLEAKLRSSLAEVEGRERKLAVAESDSKRNIAAKMEEVQVLQRRIRAESSHTILMAERKTEAADARASYAEERLSKIEARAKVLEEEYAAYRAESRKTPEALLKDEISQLKGKIIEMEKRLEEEMRERGTLNAEKNKLALQVQKLVKALLAERQKNENATKSDMEKLRVKYMAREEKYMLDGDRDELRAIRRELENLRIARMSTATRNPATHNPELSRLVREKNELLSSGAGYTEESALIQELNRRIKAIQ